MTEASTDNPLFLNTVVLGGSTADKLAAVRDAGFDQIELWRQDVDAVEGGASEARTLVGEYGVGLTDYQVLADFEGAPDERREAKRAEARAVLDAAVLVGAPAVLVAASTDPACVVERVDEDMRWLARQAGQRGLRIAYEAMAWSTVHHTLQGADELVNRLGEPGLGLVVDTFHLLARGGSPRIVETVDPRRIALVQLCDLDRPVDDLEVTVETARHRRLLPGQGCLPLDVVTGRLHAMGYTGPVGLEVFNDDLHAEDPAVVARRSMAALRAVWAGS